MQQSNSTAIGTLGGTFLSILPNLHSEDILKTVALATIGALVSFLISVVLKYFSKKYKNKV